MKPDVFADLVVGVIKKSLAAPKAHIQSLEQRVTELASRNAALQQEVLDLTSLVHLLHDKVDSPKAAAVIRDVH